MVANILNLAGQWTCLLDHNDKGMEEKWYKKVLEGQLVNLPGTTNQNKLGEPLDTTGLSDKEMVKRLRQNYYYEGLAWYQRTLTIEDLPITNGLIVLERVMFASFLWVNGTGLGRRDSLSCPHEFEVPFTLEPGESYTLTIAVDNRDVAEIGQSASAYTEETQSIWNGVVGDMLLMSRASAVINHIKVIPKYHEGKAQIELEVKKFGKEPQMITLALKYYERKGLPQSSKELPINLSQMTTKLLVLKAPMTKALIEIDLEDTIGLWDEFEQHLYELRVVVIDQDDVMDTNKASKAHILDEKTQVFGIREWKTHENQFFINDQKIFLRGTLDCCIFPKTGYPPTDREPWHKIFTTLKAYGLNHLRFHSWCPPKEAFNAADEHGVYLLVEGPVWMDTWCGMTVGSRPNHYSYLMDEAKGIVHTYGHHPSFCFFSNGNELNGDFNLLHNIITELKEDPRFLYTLTSNWDRKVDDADDFFITQTVDGIGVRGQYFKHEMVESSTKAYDEVISMRDIPIVSHEVGQYCVYPQMKELVKYDGCLQAVNFQWIKDDLVKKGLLDLAERYTYASGQLALELYKAEIEMALRTQGLGGFQLLDLHDFPGQSTATVGILDAFWDSKGIVVPENFRQFCNGVVPLILCDQRVIETSKQLTFNVKIANYGDKALDHQTMTWTLLDSKHQVMNHGTYETRFIAQGQVVSLETITIPEGVRSERSQILTLEVAIPDRAIKNDLELYLVPTVDSEDENKSSAYEVYHVYDQTMKEALQAGKSVLYMPNQKAIATAVKGNYFPVMWSPVHFVSSDSCGAMIQKDHPLFAAYETKDYAGFSWMHLMEHSFTVDMDVFLERIDPMFEMVPNFFNNCRRSPLFEANVDQGKILFCGFDLSSNKVGIEGSYFLHSIKTYMESNAFSPSHSMSFDGFEKLHKTSDDDNTLTGTNIALGKPSKSDSEEKDDHKANKGNDGIGHTYWKAADQLPGHWWQVDLGAVVSIVGTKVKFEEEANYLYVIQTSLDGKQWKVSANQTGQTQRDQERIDLFDEEARYVRIVYNGSPDDVVPAHYNFEVYV